MGWGVAYPMSRMQTLSLGPSTRCLVPCVALLLKGGYFWELRAGLDTPSRVHVHTLQRVCADGVLVQLPHSASLDVDCSRDVVFELGGWECMSSILDQIGS